MNRYQLYVSDSSYFSGKLEAFVRYKGIAHDRHEINVTAMREVILPNTGLIKVPVMQCPDGRWLKDTTPMMAWLDREHPQAGIYPADPAARFLAELIEDYADEWMWRPAMYYRWAFPDSHRFRRSRLGHELAAGTLHPAFLMGWYFRWRQYFVFVRGDGVRAHNRAAVEANYHRTLRELGAILEDRPFLSGTRPGIADFAFFGSMFRHYALDPHPAKIMVDTAPAVWAWVARVWNARADREGAGALEDFSASAWDAIFRDIAVEYAPYLDANARAYAQGAKRFDLTLPDATYPSMPVVRYRVACRSRILRAFLALDPFARTKVGQRLAASGVAQWLESARDIDAGLDAEFVMPLERRYPPARGLHGLRMYQGTPWDLPKPPIDKPQDKTPP